MPVMMADMHEERGTGCSCFRGKRTGVLERKKGLRPKGTPLFVSGLFGSYMKNRKVIRAKIGQRMPTDQAM